MINNIWRLIILSVIVVTIFTFIVPPQHTLAQSQQESASPDFIGGEFGPRMVSGPDAVVAAASKKKGTIIVNPGPDELNAPWSLTGPNKYKTTGTGDKVLTNLNPGSYTLTWGDVDGWVTPSPNPETRDLVAGSSIEYAGNYSPILKPPSVDTDPPADVTGNGAVVCGTLTGLGDYTSADVSFEWGTISGALDNTTTAQTMKLPGKFSDKLTHLSASTTYYFRAKAVSKDITVYGKELSFTTLRELTMITLVPESPNIPVGCTQQFTATGTYSDLSAEDITSFVTWSSDNTDVAAINESTGLASGQAEGQTTISAALGNVTGSTLLTVTPLKALNITITGSGNTTPEAGIHMYPQDINVNVTAIPAGGWAFEKWTGDVADNASASTVVTMDSDKNVTAYFIRVSATLTLAVSGSGATEPAAGSHTCAIGSTIDIKAVPASGYTFVNWTGDTAAVADVGASATMVTIADDCTLVANFAEIQSEDDDGQETNDTNTGEGIGNGGAGGGSGGDGGGSGGANGKTITGLRSSSSASGVVWADVTAASVDARLKLDIPYGTKCTNANGNALTSITITEINESDTAKSGVTAIGKTYELGPAGASFDPPIILTIRYSDADIPVGTLESSLGIVYWEAEGGTYEIIDCRVDTEANTITAHISHFSRYAIISLPRPAEFVLSALSISPASVNQGDTVSISITASNTGDVSGSYEISLVIDGILTQTKSVSVSGSGRETVSFSVTADTAGEHTVNIEDLSGRFTVNVPEVNTPELAPETPAPSPLPAPEITPVSEPAPAPASIQPIDEIQPPVTSSPVAALPVAASSANWWLLNIIIAGVAILVGLIIFSIVSHKRA
jgi:uncharacterized repeat protein (TIGR02543 family)